MYDRCVVVLAFARLNERAVCTVLIQVDMIMPNSNNMLAQTPRITMRVQHVSPNPKILKRVVGFSWRTYNCIGR